MKSIQNRPISSPTPVARSWPCHGFLNGSIATSECCLIVWNSRPVLSKTIKQRTQREKKKKEEEEEEDEKEDEEEEKRIRGLRGQVRVSRQKHLRLRSPSLICRTWRGADICPATSRERNVQLCHHTWWPRCRLLGARFASTSNVFPGVNTRGRLTEAVLSPSHVQRRGPSRRTPVSVRLADMVRVVLPLSGVRGFF